MDYEKLKDYYNKNGTSYKLVKRNEKAALYQQFNDMGDPIGFETFCVKVQPEYKFPNGIINPSKEAFPSNESFGLWAWAFSLLTSAEKRFDEITNGQVRPEREEIIIEKPIIDPDAPKRGRGRPRKYPVGSVPTLIKKKKEPFIFEGKEYKNKAAVGRILLQAGEGKVSIAKKLKCTQQSVHNWYRQLNPNVVVKSRNRK